jgi:phosphate starvation-inducible PhoH-like protein
MRPLFDVLGEMLDDTAVNKYMERGTLEVAPLAFMRGRTLSDSFVILDEAQNATDDQLKMFLTRLGSGSKMVVTGDVTQIDLPAGQRSGLRAAANRLGSIDGIAVVELDENDVVRHPLVAQIVRAYRE